LFHTIEAQIKTMEKNLDLIRSELATSRNELLKLEGRVAQLEEARKTTEAQMRAIQAETVAELRAIKAETMAELRVQQVKKEAELYTRFLETQTSARSLPSVDKSENTAD
jgi:hypothetical protein